MLSHDFTELLAYRKRSIDDGIDCGAQGYEIVRLTLLIPPYLHTLKRSQVP